MLGKPRFALGVQNGLSENITGSLDLWAAYGSHPVGQLQCEVDEILALEARPCVQGAGIGPQRLDASRQARRLVGCQRLRTSILEIGKRSEEPTSELQSLMRISYAVF